jgi:hypothetical protein
MLAEFRLKAETLLENGERSVSLYGGEGTAVYAMRPDWHVIFRGGLDHRDDHDIHDRSGLYAWSGIFGRWFFSEQGHSLLFGVKGYGADAHASRFNFVGVEPSVNLNLNLPWQTELMLGLGWHVEQYNGPATVLGGSDRHDRQWRTSVFAVKKLSDNFQIEAGWQYRDNRSNSDLYQYDQHMFLLGWALVF